MKKYDVQIIETRSFTVHITAVTGDAAELEAARKNQSGEYTEISGTSNVTYTAKEKSPQIER